jgi:hypothetical protein
MYPMAIPQSPPVTSVLARGSAGAVMDQFARIAMSSLSGPGQQCGPAV